MHTGISEITNHQNLLSGKKKTVEFNDFLSQNYESIEKLQLVFSLLGSHSVFGPI